MGRLLSPALAGQVMDFDPYGTRTEADPTHQYGTLVLTNHGRDMYRHGKVGASNVSKALLQLAPAPIANHQNQTIDAASNVAIGDTHLTLNNGGTAAAAGEYDQGYFAVVDGTGEGQTLGVLHNLVAGTSADIVVDLDQPLAVALVAGTTEYALVHNPYNAFVEAAVEERTAAGIPLRDLTAGDFGWLKTNGVVSAKGGSAVTLGGDLCSDGSTAGAVTDATDQTGVDTFVKVANASIVAGATGEFFPIVLKIG